MANVPHIRDLPFGWPDPQTGPYVISMDLMPVRGRVECTQLTIKAVGAMDTAEEGMTWLGDDEAEPATISSSLLRDIPLARIIGERAQAYVDDGEQLLGHAAPLEFEEAAGRQRGGRRPNPPSYFVEVAEVYAKAHARRGKPTQAVADHFIISHSTAAKHVMEARRRGLLPPTQKGMPRA